MAIEVIVPRLGWSMDEGVFVEWLKKEGERVRPGEMLFVIEGDKAAVEIECFDEGILYLPPDCPKPGDSVVVGQRLAFLLADGESPPPSDATPQANEKPAHQMKAATPVVTTAPIQPKFDKPRATPRAKRKARELGIDWSTLTGSGKEGRVRERDVVAVAQSKERHAPSANIRQTIARRMHTSHTTTAPVTLTTTVDVTHTVGLRQQFKTAASQGQVVPTYTDIIIKLAAIALTKHPHLNARWESDRVVLADEVHIGLAVDTDDGLLVPVVRDPAGRSLRDIASHTADLIARARDRRLAGRELSGATFTVSNLGAFGIDAFTPIINLPECAILGVGRIARRPVADGDQLVLRDTVTLSLTFDHRVVDGAPAARFLQTLSQLLENPAAALVG